MPFSHIALATSDIEATHRFYTGPMGFRLAKVVAAPTPGDTGWARHVFYDCGEGEYIAFWDIHDATIPAVRGDLYEPVAGQQFDRIVAHARRLASGEHLAHAGGMALAVVGWLPRLCLLGIGLWLPHAAVGYLIKRRENLFTTRFLGDRNLQFEAFLVWHDDPVGVGVASRDAAAEEPGRSLRFMGVKKSYDQRTLVVKGLDLDVALPGALDLGHGHLPIVRPAAVVGSTASRTAKSIAGTPSVTPTPSTTTSLSMPTASRSRPGIVTRPCPSSLASSDDPKNMRE